jgi:hypothetical protein
MITRRGLFGILAGAVAAPIVARSGLLMPVKALIVPSLSIEDQILRYIVPSMELIAEQIEDDLFMYGTAFRRDTYVGGKVVSERIDPASAFLQFEVAS